MGNVRLLTREEIIEANHVVPLLDEPLAKMGAQEAGAAGDQDAFDLCHAYDESKCGPSLSPQAGSLLCLTDFLSANCHISRGISRVDH